MVQNANAQLTTLQQQDAQRETLPPTKQSLDSLTKDSKALRRRSVSVAAGGGGGGGFGGGTENVRGRIGQLKGAIMASTALPTTTQLMQIREVKARVGGRRRAARLPSCRWPLHLQVTGSVGVTPKSTLRKADLRARGRVQVDMALRRSASPMTSR